jgi:hypothetical protein
MPFRACCAKLLLPLTAILAFLGLYYCCTFDTAGTVVRHGVKYEVFRHADTGARLEYIRNSGVCETTPGVNQISGYVSDGRDMEMWFWYVSQEPR